MAHPRLIQKRVIILIVEGQKSYLVFGYVGKDNYPVVAMLGRVGPISCSASDTPLSSNSLVQSSTPMKAISRLWSRMASE